MATKICSKCKQSKPLLDFYGDKQKKDNLTSSCKQCGDSVGKVHRENVQGDDELRQKRNAYHRQYRRSNIRKYREYHRLKKREYNKTPVGKYWNKRGDAKRLGIVFNITRGEFVAWFNEQKPWECYYCGVSLEFIGGADRKLRGLTIDRKVNTGGYTLDNICMACRRCNTIKGAWFSEREMLEIARGYLLSKSFT